MTIRTAELIEILRSYDPAAAGVTEGRIFRHWEDIARWIQETEARLERVETNAAVMEKRLAALELTHTPMIRGSG